MLESTPDDDVSTPRATSFADPDDAVIAGTLRLTPGALQLFLRCSRHISLGLAHALSRWWRRGDPVQAGFAERMLVQEELEKVRSISEIQRVNRHLSDTHHTHSNATMVGVAPTAPVVRVAGRSMEPTLPVGSIVCVTDDIGSIEIGDVVLLEGSALPIVHRLIHLATVGDDTLVYHRGDNGGGIGVAKGAALLGRVVAIIEPDRRPIPRLSDLHAGLRRRFRRARICCRFDACGRSIAFLLGLDRGRWARTIGRMVRENLLGRFRA